MDLDNLNKENDIKSYMGKIPNPKWIDKISNDDNYKPTINELLGTEHLFYPGSGKDEEPILVFCDAIHLYIYSDYTIKKEEILNWIKYDNKFEEYKLKKIINYNQNDFLPRNYRQTVTEEEIIKRSFTIDNRNLGRTIEPYCFLALYYNEINNNQFGILYFGSDSIALYDVLYSYRPRIRPHIVVCQDHGFGNLYSSFGNEGLIHYISKKNNIYPKYIYVAEGTEPWEEYADMNLQPGEYNQRKLFKKI